VQTAQDGVQLHQLIYNPDPAAPTNQGFPVPAKAVETDQGWVTTGSLAAGNRIDLLVQAPSTPGSYPVNFTNNFGQKVLLLTVKVAGTAVSAVAFPSQTEFPKRPDFLDDIRPPVGMVTREIRFNTTKTQLPSPSPTPIPPGSTGGRNPTPTPTPAIPPSPTPTPSSLFPNAPPTHTINGKQFTHEVEQHMKLGATEEWNLFNDTPKGGPAHPFHIHVNPFQVIALFDPAYMNESQRAEGVTLRRPWVWWDDFAIPPGGWVKMWTRFVDFTGTYVFHCHILGHEDRGMMQLVEVYPARTPMKHK
jgi:FtsP/CotA-like multicopper oxidase with cupredoxin domain